MILLCADCPCCRDARMQGDYRCINLENSLTDAAGQETLLAKFLHLIRNPAAFRPHSQENPAVFFADHIHQTMFARRIGKQKIPVVTDKQGTKIFNKWFELLMQANFRQTGVNRLFQSMQQMRPIFLRLQKSRLPETFFHPIGVE